MIDKTQNGQEGYSSASSSDISQLITVFKQMLLYHRIVVHTWKAIDVSDLGQQNGNQLASWLVSTNHYYL